MNSQARRSRRGLWMVRLAGAIAAGALAIQVWQAIAHLSSDDCRTDDFYDHEGRLTDSTIVCH